MYIPVLDRTVPLLSAQQEIWIADRAGDDASAFLSAQVTALPAGVDPALFVEACRVAIRQTEMLRLRLTGISAQFVVPADNAEAEIPLIDLTAESDPDQAAERWMAAARGTPIDPARSAPFAWALLALAPDRLLWSQITHHVVSDWNGRHLVVARVAAIYNALARNLPPPEPDAAPCLADLVAEEMNYFAGERYLDAAAWCVEQCADRPASMSLSGRSTVVSQSGRRATRRVDPAQSHALQAAAARLNVSLAQLLCAAWAALLSRLSGQTDLLIGFQVAARRPAARDVPAMTTNQMPLRLSVAADARFADMAALTRRQCRTILRHQHYPQMHLRRALGLTPADPDLIDIGFNFLPLPAAVTIGGAALETRNLSHGPVRDLMLAVEPSADGGLILDLDANLDRYAADEVERLIGRLALMLTRLAASPDTVADVRIADLPVMTADEHELVSTVFSSGGPPPPSTTLAAMLAARFAATPDVVALEVAGGRLSFGALGVRANRLARHLLAQGFGPGDVAGLALPRGEDLIVSVVACMLAGIAICPLDPAHPPERQRFMLEDSGASVLIGREADRGGPHGLKLLAIDAATTRRAVARQSADPLTEAELPAPVTGETIAYIAFTSGSTGRPKGVAIHHAAIAQHINASQIHFPVGVGDAVICVTTLTFDVGISDLFFALTSGAVLVLLREHEMRDPAAIRDAIRAHPSPLLQATPSLCRSLPIEQLPASLRAVIGGEAFPGDLLPRLRRLAGVFNGYGPTEATVGATVHRVTEQDGIDRPVPVGRPLAGYQVWILDRLGRHLPIDGIGELCIGGPAVAAGYLGQPALTAAAFVEAPFGAGQMYRTGDLARWRPDGAIEVLGRRDGQVKIAGHRIELAEIEHAMLGLPWFAEVAVLARGEKGRQRLVAYAVPRDAAEMPDIATLRRALAARLPAWMIPAELLALASMPRTTADKIDRQALKAAPGAPPPTPAAPVTAASPLISLLQRAFARAANRAEVAPDADFFEIGGDSLGAMVLLTELSQAGCEVPLPLLMERRTPAAIAAAMMAPPQQAVPRAGVPLVFLIHGAGGHSPDVAALQVDCAAELRFVVLDYPDWRRMLAPGFGMTELVAYFATQIGASAPSGPIILAGYSLGAAIAMAVATALRDAGREVAGLLLFDLTSIAASPQSGDRQGLRRRANRLAVALWRNVYVRTVRQVGREPRLLGSVLRLCAGLPPRWRYWFFVQTSVTLQIMTVAPWRKSVQANPRLVTGLRTILFHTGSPTALRDEDAFWHRSGGDVRRVAVPGDHYSILRERGPSSLRHAVGPVVTEILETMALTQPSPASACYRIDTSQLVAASPD
jgi:amino acid adenylation domain-containing protein